jgi:Na+/H+ antiporter NhaD/arsenite permease-like protein
LPIITIFSAVVIVITLIGVAVGRYPWLRMNRATIALVGATILIIMGGITLQQAYAAIDLNTITLLFAMMVINVNLRLAGFFQLAVSWITRLAKTPRQLLALLILFSGVLSALFLNDTIVLMFTPLVIELTSTLKRNPIPYLIGLVSAANIGSTATIIGNPQNIIIGIASNIPFLTFTGHLAPIALIGLGIAWVVLIIVYPQEFSPALLANDAQLKPQTFTPLLIKDAIATGLAVIAFMAGAPIPLAALSAAAFLLVTRRIKPARVFQELDWSLLVFFSGLFIVTGALATNGLTDRLFKITQPIAEQGVLALTAVSVILSNLISNVPAVLLFRSLVPHFSNPQLSWLTLAMATTLAGNLTLLGSVANLIVAESAWRRGVNLSFLEYLKTGAIITLATLIVGIVWLDFLG